MRLSKVAIMALKGSDSNFKEKLAVELGVSPQTLYRYIAIADKDDTLTKAGALELIRSETGLSDEFILEKETTELG